MNEDVENQEPFPDLDAAGGLRAAFKTRPGSSGNAHRASIAARLAAHAERRGYELQGEIARGGMGVVVKAFDRGLTRDVALKVLRDELADEPSLVRRFYEEARVTARLDHPGIVPVHEVGRDPTGRAYFAMRLVRGRDLRRIIELANSNQEGWSQTRALSVLLKVCEAMAYAHDKGVLHRDLKPANVMVGEFGEVYVMDWGLARVIGHDDAHDIRLRAEPEAAGEPCARGTAELEAVESPIVTMDGDVLGTPCYMSPEQARGSMVEIGPHSDVYAVGSMLYHLLADEMPYVPAGTYVASRTVLTQLVEGPPRPLHELRRELPAELITICERAMARDPGNRYAGMLNMAEDLRAFLERRVVRAYETGAWAEAKQWVRRNKPLAASLAVAVALLVAGLTTSLVFKVRADENAKLADERADETAEQARIARANEQVATQRANDVLSLSAIQDLKELEDRADALWPAVPENVPRYDAWLADARYLIDGRPADTARGVAGRPSLAEHKAKLAEIRRRATPLSAEQLEANRRASPNFAEWEKARAQLGWLRRMLGEEPWPSETAIEADLAQVTLPSDAIGLNELVWPLVDPDPTKAVYGDEVKALVLARRALARANDAQRAGIRDTLGWALYRVGHLDAALTEERRAVDEASGRQKAALAASLKTLEESAANWRTVEGRGEQSQYRTKLEARVAELAADLDDRRTHEFEDGRDRWWNGQLSKLVADLEAFVDPTMGLFSSGVSPEHSWGVVKRRDFAATIDERSVSGSETARRWAEAIESIARSEKYRDTLWPSGQRLTAQLGLLPIGADRDSGLWEFAHLGTGVPAERDADGKLVLTEDTGLVLVLIPGGAFWMGAQSTDPDELNYDPQAQAVESPVHEVTLSPYFLSKYEMTQGQWQRIAGLNPSPYTANRYDPAWNREHKGWSALHPVGNVSWTDCTQLLGRMSLVLPTEAQWEFGCRAGTSTVYWSGDEAATLHDVGNVADAFAKVHGGSDWTLKFGEWDDGNTVPAQVGSYRANAFGLHDMHGNEWEWCRDVYADYALGTHAGDGERSMSGAQARVFRGGSFLNAFSIARSARRHHGASEARDDSLGLRPARDISY